jgi:hypothetical protein
MVVDRACGKATAARKVSKDLFIAEDAEKTYNTSEREFCPLR